MSNLFDQASLICTPNGYKAGKLYSIKPTSGAGDLDVVRATSATRVNASGLIEIPRTNLLLRSEEFEDAYWSKSSITVTPNASLSPSGTMTADLLTPTGTGLLRRIFGTIASGTYTASIYLKSDTGSSFTTRLVFRDTVNNITQVQNITVSTDWQRFNIVFTTAGTTGFEFWIGGAGTLDTGKNLLAWGAQLEVGNVATEYIPTTSVIRTRFAGITQDGGSANNIPRLDYTNASCPSILVEPQRTNLLLRSEEFDNASWSKTNTTITANSVIAPDGTLTADTINVSVQDVERVIQRVLVGTSISGSTYTGSIWIKGQGSNIGKLVRFRIKRNSGGTLSDVVVNYTLTSNWVRISATFTGLTDNTGIAFGFDGATNYADSFDVWGAQLEVGSNATSYIPTQASTVTRNADVISKTGISSLIGQTEGTLFAEVRVSRLLGVASRYIFHLSDGTSNNRIYIAFSGASSNILRARIFNGGVLQANIESSTITTLGTFKLALAYNNNDIVFYINGVQIGTDTSATIPTCSRVDVGHNQAGASQFNDSINSALIFPTRLSNTELAQLTTL